jgi:hypothetical protein
MAERSARKQKKEAGSGRTRVEATDLPRRSLEKAIAVIKPLHETFAAKPTTIDDLAKRLDLSPNNVDFKYNLWSAQAYGLVTRDASQKGTFALAETGRKILAPTYEGEDAEARLKAILTPAILSKFYTDYNGHQIPGEPHFSNLLTSKYGVPSDRSDEAIAIITENATSSGILVVKGTQTYIQFGDGGTRLATSINQGTTTPSVSDENESAEGEWNDTCFFITPIGDEGSEQRKHSDMVLKHLVSPVAAEHKLKVVRSDKIEKAGLITKQIFEHIVQSRLCITDMSFNNANVFYELGVRHMTKRPAIQLIRKADKIPFDVSQGRTIVFDTSDVYTVMDRLLSAKRELSEHVTASLQNGESDEGSPVKAWLPNLKVTLG